MRIKEAMEKANQENPDNKIKMIDLGRELWPDAETHTQQMSISKLMNGARPMVRIEHVPKICKVLKCDANFLFDIKPMK